MTKPQVPANVEWGPVLWHLMHALAEKAGSAPMPGLRGDEVRAWKNIITTLPKALVCEECRIHLVMYISNNPVNIPDHLTNYGDLRNYVRNYLYNLHESVNKRLNKPSFSTADLSLLYGGVNLKVAFDVLQIVIKRSIVATAVPILSWTSWTTHAKTLIGMYN